MKRALLVICCVGLAGGLANAAELSPNRTVFILPMGHSLDQFIADQLTRMHVLQVVTDPAKADTVVSDHVGEPLETRLQELYPELAPKPPKETATTKESAAKDTAAAAKETPAKDDAPAAAAVMPDDTARQRTPPPIFGDVSNQPQGRGNMASAGHGRGTIFLVDVKSGQVLWSVFDPPRNSTPRELDHTAERIVKRLRDDMSPPKK